MLQTIGAAPAEAASAAGEHPLKAKRIYIPPMAYGSARAFAAAFRAIGGFSQELFAAEEIDLSRRLKLRARETGKRVIILHRHPIVTSARKLRLYTMGEHLRFLARTVFGGGKTLASREACHTWYDGRRL